MFARLLANADAAFVTLQNIAEFWNVATRPIVNNGLGLSTEFVLNEVSQLEREFEILPDTPAVYAEWKRLVTQNRVMGTKVHDTRLVATMRVHGFKSILTFNTEDFARYEIEALHPLNV